MDFKFMDATVDDICKSMENDHARWHIETHTVKDKRSGVEYWLGSWNFFHVWNGHSNEKVFSESQVSKIRDSYKKMRETKASIAQERVKNSFLEVVQEKPVQEKPVQERQGVQGYGRDEANWVLAVLGFMLAFAVIYWNVL